MLQIMHSIKLLLVFSLLFFNCIPFIGLRSRPITGEELSNLSQITTHDKDDYYPAISSDGKFLLFTSNRDGNSNIYLKTNINAPAIIRKTSHSKEDIYPVFSPDMTRFAFSSNRFGNYDIFVMNLQRGTSITQITENSNDESFPDWSPDELNV